MPLLVAAAILTMALLAMVFTPFAICPACEWTAVRTNRYADGTWALSYPCAKCKDTGKVTLLQRWIGVSGSSP